jgi:hypothetical protein
LFRDAAKSFLALHNHLEKPEAQGAVGKQPQVPRLSKARRSPRCRD